MSSVTSASYLAVQWFQQVWRNRDREAIRELLAPDACGHLEGMSKAVSIDEFLTFRDAMLDTFPDLEVRMLRVMGNDTDACLHWQASGTHKGSGLGFAPTGRKLDFQGMTWMRVRDGKIIEGRDCWNLDRLLAQMKSPLAAAGSALPL